MSDVLTVADVARELKVSENTARKIIRENGPIHVGKLLRWTRRRMDAFMRRGGQGQWQDDQAMNDSTSVAECGGRGDTITKASDGKKARTSETSAPRLRLVKRSTKSTLFPDIEPRTVARSRKR